MPIDFKNVTYLTFDCYGTLIDWEAGIIDALQPILNRHGHALDPQSLLESHAMFEAAIESGPYRSYRQVLSDVIDRFGVWLGFSPTDDDRAAFSGSVGLWPPFTDSKGALAELGRHFRLVALTNVDDDLFVGSDHQLGQPFHAVFTAQQIGSYKPSRTNFRYAIDRLGGDPMRIVHVAQSLYHDVAPASDLDLQTVWINRRSNQKGSGATPAATAKPDMEFPSLEALVAYLGRNLPNNPQ